MAVSFWKSYSKLSTWLSLILQIINGLICNCCYISIIYTGFQIEQFKVCVNDKKGTIKIEGQRPLDGNRWSRFRQNFKVSPHDYRVKDINARFHNGVLSLTLPKNKPSDDDHTSNPYPFANKIYLLLRIAPALLVGVGGYGIFEYLKSISVIGS